MQQEPIEYPEKRKLQYNKPFPDGNIMTKYQCVNV